MMQDRLADIGGGEVLGGNALTLYFNDPSMDPRSPDLVLTPNLGTVYTGKKKKVAEHGGFLADSTNVILLVAGSGITAGPIQHIVSTTQVAPTILKALGMDPNALQGVQNEGTPVLLGLPFTK